MTGCVLGWNYEGGGGRSDVLLAMTTKKPREKTPATASLSLSFIWRRETMVMGRQIIITSVKMLTGSKFC
jgi:hypothetical protein